MARAWVCDLHQISQRPCIASQHFSSRSTPASPIFVPPRPQGGCRARLGPVYYRQGEEVPAPASPLSVPTAQAGPDAQVQGAPTGTSGSTSQARTQLKVIGLGLRGISAVNRLIASGSLPEAEFWALDCDKRVLATADGSTRVLEVGPGDEASLDPADLAALSGDTTAPAAPEAPDGHAGAVFVLGSAFGSPGGAPMLLQLVRHLRRQGYFVAAALTRPFEFEGARRLEAADTLIATMEEVAHLVVVIAQGVLTRASAELTMGQAEAIADNTLVYTVQSTLWALRAPEVLKVSHGAFLWHGRDLRNIRRPLFPPMMNLLSCPGHATLGRGQAALPMPLLQQAGLASALSTLAEDAVKAASESPFLDHKLESATGVLCVLRVPPSALGVGVAGSPRQGGSAGGGGTGASGSNVGSGGPLVADNHKEYALRSAVQVAAMTVRDLVGPHCHDIIVCPQLCHDLEDSTQQQQPAASQAAAVAPGSSEGAPGAGSGTPGTAAAGGVTEMVSDRPAQPHTPLVRLEVSLLVLERIEEAADAAKLVAGKKLPGDAPSKAAAGAAAAPGYVPSSPAVLTAATARDRITSVISPRTSATGGGAAPGAAAPVRRRLPVPGAPTPAASYFSAHSPAPQAPAASPAGTHPAWSAAGAGEPSAPAGAHPAGAHPAVAANTAAAAAAAETNRARKQARLAAMSAMSALAGGTASGAGIGGTGLHGQPAGMGGTARGVTAHGPAPLSGQAPAAPVAAATPGSTWTGQISARGLPMNAAAPGHHQPQHHHHLHPQTQQQPPQQQQPQPVAANQEPGADCGMFGLKQIPRMAENLQVTSLVAQSLDLPPQAAKWRHQQRRPPRHARGPTPTVFHLPKVDGGLCDVDDTWVEDGSGQGEGLGRGLQQLIMGMRLPGLSSDIGGPGGAAAGPAAVRNRVAGMLDLERKDLWDGPA